ncbi:uncharacterized protein B0P05DRAFT_547850 [Gilbertella persicaria]|uniref:uncharacterized protein n=1 Tax=Gilbertella persicaria TaxID=101096 RepID=UPI00222015E3|nr:uncharacterized protein B0P05DRAFT_547850 [Gilbertella persicaria]KAI8074244.1 hypothetical protein B0P05DRAFT_547850 [Gilbertella persicaria]
MVKNIAREQAICIFFCHKHTESNVKKLLKRMESFEDVDICYDKNPLQPILLYNERIDCEPLRYKRYNTSSFLIENSLIH